MGSPHVRKSTPRRTALAAVALLVSLEGAAAADAADAGRQGPGGFRAASDTGEEAESDATSPRPAAEERQAPPVASAGLPAWLDEPEERASWLTVAAGLLWWVPVLPMMLYVVSGWEARKREVLALFNADSIETYFYQFYPGGGLFEISVPSAERSASLARKMEAHYRHHSSRWRFVVAGLLLAAILGVALAWMARTVQGWLEEGALPRGGLASPAMAALSGGYLRVGIDLIEHWRSRAFTPTEPLRAALRFSIAVPAAYAVASVFADGLAMGLAFLVGFLPMEQLISFLKRLLAQHTEIELESEERPETLRLPPVDDSTARRFKAQGITTVAGLAYANPVVLAIRTQLPFVYVTQCVNVALLWLYIGDKLERTSALGISGAQEAANLYDGAQRARAQQRQDAPELATLRRLSRIVFDEEDEGATLNLLGEVGEDPHTIFLTRLWLRPSPDLVRAIAQAHVVFRGEVLQREDPPPDVPALGATFDQKVRYRVVEVLRGRGGRCLAGDDEVEVVHRMAEAGAAHPGAPDAAEDQAETERRFPRGATFLVMAREQDGALLGCDHVAALVASAENARQVRELLMELEAFRTVGFFGRLVGREPGERAGGQRP